MPTAIVRAYSKDGFVIAADRRFSNFTKRKPISDDRQKVFPIGNRPLAYSMIGITKLGHRDETIETPRFEFDLAVAKGVQSTSMRDSWSMEHYARKLCWPIYAALRDAVRGGEVGMSFKLPPDDRRGSPIVNLLLDGYVDGRPNRVTVRFYHEDGKVGEPEILSEEVELDKAWFYGSPLVANKFMGDDSAFSKYRKARPPAHPSMKLSEHISIALGYLESCSSEEGLAVDPECWNIGGLPSIATITPADGFQWVPGYGH